MRSVMAEQNHIIPILPPQDINGGKNTDVFSMKDASHVTIIIKMGSTGASSTITVEECSNFTPSAYTAIAFKYAACTTDSSDVLGSLTDVANTGFASSTNDNIFYVIEIDSEQLSDGYPNLRVCFSNPSASVLTDVTAILSGLSYAGDANRTQIA